jgi:pyruvate formate-lyase activating enzyme-like uncharacterized protein
VNLNELEFSETNEDKLHERSYELDPSNGWGVRGSRAVAQRVVRDVKLSIPVHYCSSRFKDGVQLKQRFHRRAERTRAPFALTTDDGTLVFGVVEAPAGRDVGPWAARLVRAHRLGPRSYRVDFARRRLELGVGRARRLAPRLSAPAFAVEEYPTADALEVEREPLNRAAFPGPAGGGT